MLLDLLFPKHCLNCRRVGSYICPDCTSTLQRHQQICIVCRQISPQGATHPHCQKYSAINNLVVACIYKDTLQKGIRSIKYHFAHDIIHELCTKTLQSTKIAQFITNSRFSMVTDIPAHIQKFNQRGFNLPSLICQWIERSYSIPYIQVLQKNRFTQPQASLKRQDRLFNTLNSFNLLPSSEITPGSKVLLVDDILTTASTLEQAARALRSHSDFQITALVIASSR